MVATTESFAVSETDAPSTTPAGTPRDGARTMSRAKLRANRLNAQKSTGPRTPDGKARSSRNSTSHGIFCRDVVLPGEDQDLFAQTRQDFLRVLKPQDAVQLAMVDGALAARWRLNRCQNAERSAIERRTRHPHSSRDSDMARIETQYPFSEMTPEKIAARCARNAPLRTAYLEWCELRERSDESRQLGNVVVELLDDQRLDRLSRYAHRLEHSFHRCLRDLHVLKQRIREYAEEPDSPFLDEALAEAADPAREDAAATPSPRVLLRGEGGGEGQAALGDDSRSIAEAVVAHGENFEVDRNSTPRATDPSPQPSPRRTGERETDANPPAQNEPTAENSTASPGPADTSNNDSRKRIDPDAAASDIRLPGDRAYDPQDTA